MSQCGVGNPHKGLSAMCQYAETTQGVWVLDADITVLQRVCSDHWEGVVFRAILSVVDFESIQLRTLVVVVAVVIAVLGRLILNWIKGLFVDDFWGFKSFGTAPITCGVIDLLKGVISWVVPRKIVITEVEVVGHLDVVHHGNVHDPIVHAELRLKHGLEKKTIKRKADYIFNYRYWGGEVWGKPVVYDKTPRGKRKGRKGEFDHVGVSKTLWPTEGWLETLYYEVEVKKRNRRKIRVSSWDLSPEEAMEEELIQKTDKFHLKMCNLRWKMNCHENRKTMRRKEERRAKVSYRNSALSGLWAEEAHC